MAGATSAEYPFAAFVYSIEIKDAGSGDHGVVAGFSEVSGLAVEVEVETLREGGENRFEHQIAGPAKYSSRLVLKRGLGDSYYLWSWYLKVMQGEIERRDVTVVLNDPTHKKNRRWTFHAACPVKWTGPDLHAANSAVAFESVELVHRGVLP
ncbi:phage tail protein [Paraburkholderia sp. GAS334]|jgi:phage tail-like protein|uniref:phage tail protein n=1 Tax=unclassified Paraburkholderia TaxID=2615204 RepID=UPI003D1E4E22